MARASAQKKPYYRTRHCVVCSQSRLYDTATNECVVCNVNPDRSPEEPSQHWLGIVDQEDEARPTGMQWDPAYVRYTGVATVWP